MIGKSFYDALVDVQEVDFTAHATIPSMGSAILNIAGVDAHNKGFGVDTLNQSNRSWVLSRMAIELDLRPVQYTNYRVATWISDYGRVVSTRNFTLDDANGRQFGRAVTLWAMLDLETRSAVDLSGLGDQHADAVVDEPSPTEKPRKIPAFTSSQRIEHRVVYSDIDFNRHMNTMRYIDIMFDMMPLDMVTSQRSMRLDIHFLHECRYGQMLTVEADNQGDIWFFSVRNEEQEAVRASVVWR